MGKKGKPLLTAPYMTEVRRGHPVAHADGRVRVHRAVLYDKIGGGEHPCHWCQALVTWAVERGKRALVADHIDGDTWNNDPANLVPSCNGCNVSRKARAAIRCRNGHLYAPGTTSIRVSDGTRVCLICSRIRDRNRR